MSLILLGILNSQASAASSKYFISLLEQSTRNTRPERMSIDANGNTYIAGEKTRADGSFNDMYLAQFAPEGDLVWQKYIYTTASQRLSDVYVVGTDIYVTGTNNVPSPTKFYIGKFNNFGAIQWQRYIGQESTANLVRSLTVGNGNVYVVGNAFYNGKDATLLGSVSTSGTIGGVNVVYGSSAYDTPQDIVAIGSNVFTSGFTFGTNNDDAFQIHKYNSSRQLLSSLSLSRSFQIQRNPFMTTDGAGNLIFAGQSTYQAGGQYHTFIAKLNTNLDILWQRVFGGQTQPNYPFEIVTDSSNNIFVLTEHTNGLAIAKYNSSGTIQWQRTVTAPSQSFQPKGLSCDSNGDIYVTGWTSVGPASSNAFTMFLPGDGSITGTYALGGVDWTIAASSLYTASGDLAVYSYNRSELSITSESGFPSFTVANSDNTQTLINL